MKLKNYLLLSLGVQLFRSCSPRSSTQLVQHALSKHLPKQEHLHQNIIAIYQDSEEQNLASD